MKRPLKILILLVLLVLGGVVCYLFFGRKAAVQIAFPELEKLQKVKIKLESDTARITFNAIIKNNGIFKLTIDSLFYRVALDTSELLNHKAFLNIELPRGKEDTILLTVDLPFTKLQKQIKALREKDSTKIHLSVDVLYKTKFGKAKLPVERDFLIEVPTPPRFELVKTEYVSRDKKTLLVNAYLKIENRGKLDLKITNLTYKMDVKDLFTVEQVFPEKVSIKPGTEEIIVLPVHVEIKKLLKTAFLILTNNDRVPYTLKMKALVESDMVETEKTPFELVNEGMLELKK